MTGHEIALRMMTCKSHVVLYRINADEDAVSVIRAIHTKQNYLCVLFGNALLEE